jgi:hypothetical protein
VLLKVLLGCLLDKKNVLLKTALFLRMHVITALLFTCKMIKIRLYQFINFKPDLKRLQQCCVSETFHYGSDFSMSTVPDPNPTYYEITLFCSVGDPDPDLFAGSGSGYGNFSPDPDPGSGPLPIPLKVLIIRKGDFFTTTFSVL